MKQLIKDFPLQLSEAIQIAKASSLKKYSGKINNVVICGLGGSGIGGFIASKVVFDKALLPITIANDYHLPEFVNENTLIIASSYSGNTEETLSTLDQAIAKKAEIACVTSGGQVADTANKHNWNKIVIPGGNPPRSCIGYSLVQQLHLLNFYGVVKDSYLEDLEASLQLLSNNQESIIQEASNIASSIQNKIPVIYSSDRYEGVSIRFRQQINENSKMLCWHHKLPELNHNEIVGWTQKNNDLAVVILRNEDDYYRTAKRIDFTKKLVSELAGSVIEIKSKGDTVLQRSIYLIHLTDWVSVLIAELKGIDAVEIDVINALKGELADLN